MNEAHKTPSVKKRLSKKMKIIIGVISAVLLVPFGFVVWLIVTSIYNLSTDVDTGSLSSRLGTIANVRSVDASYGHSGAPWNNNLTVLIEPETENPVAIGEILKESKDIILDETGAIPDFKLDVHFVDKPAEEARLGYDGIESRALVAACALLFPPGYNDGSYTFGCAQSNITMSKGELRKL